MHGNTSGMMNSNPEFDSRLGEGRKNKPASALLEKFQLACHTIV